MAKGRGNGERIKSAEEIQLENTAKLILFGAHCVENFHPHPDIRVSRIKKQKDGFYAVTYKEHPRYGTKKTVLLDLSFPFAQDTISTIIARSEKAGRKLFLSVGADTNDYPKVENADPNENSRTFFVSDKGYGIVINRDNLKAFHDAATREDLHYPMPQETYLFNSLDAEYLKIPADTFDTIQLVNILSDPSAIGLRLVELVRILKKDSGEMVIVSTNTPSVFPLETLQKFASANGSSLEVIFHRREKGRERAESENSYMMPQETVERLLRDYHISQANFLDNSLREEGCYVVILRKNLPDETN